MNSHNRFRGPRGRFRSVVVLVGAVVLLPVLALWGYDSAEAQSNKTLAQYRAWMVEARATYPYPQSVDKMYRVMMCESSGNPRAVGGSGAWLGLFQYAPRTWRGSWNPYRNQSIWDARAQIFATAKAWSIGMQSHWSCYYKTAGR